MHVFLEDGTGTDDQEIFWVYRTRGVHRHFYKSALWNSARSCL